MTSLVRSHLARLWKSPVFLLALAAMAFAGAGLSGSAGGEFLSGSAAPGLWGQPLCGPGLVTGLALAAVCSLFFGAEYADGTIRSKLIAGRSRAGIYLAALISGLLMTLALYLAALLGGLTNISVMKNFPAPDPGALGMCLAGTALLMAGQCSLSVMLCMLIQRRAVLAVVLILLMVALLFASLQAQDAYETATGGGMQLMIDEAGRQQWVFHEPGTAGALVTLLYDALPGCQAYRYMELDAAPRMLAYSAAAAVLSTGLGLILFRRKDIR